MASLRTAITYGLISWAVPFAVSVAIYPLHESSRPLFESIMPLVVGILAATLGLRYFRRVTAHPVLEGARLGILWLAINLLIDLPLMLSEPIAMTWPEYLADVGLTYLLIPTITVSIGIARSGPAATSHG